MEFTIYTAPCKPEGITRWKQKSKKYRWGFVARIFQLGIILRLGKVPPVPVSARVDIDEWSFMD